MTSKVNPPTGRSRIIAVNSRSLRHSNATGNRAILLVVLVVYALAIGNAIPLSDTNTKCKTSVNNNEPSFCITEGCIETAIDIRRSMNLSVNPCDNFYEFSCGRYLPEGNGVSNAHEELQKKYNVIIEGKLNKTSSSNDHPVIKYAREVYQNCLSSRSDTAPSTVSRFIRDTLNVPKWPSPTFSNLKENFTSEKSSELILQFSLAPLFDVDLVQPTNEEKPLLKISGPKFELPLGLRTGRQNSNYVIFGSYARYVSTVMQEFGVQHPSLTSLQLTRISQQVIRFEQDLYDITSKHLSNTTTVETLTVELMDEITGNALETKISMRTALDHLLQKSGGRPLEDSDKIQIFNSTVLSEIVTLISSTEQEVLVNYLGYRLALQLVPLSSQLTFLHIINPYTIGGSGLPFGNRDKCLTFVKRMFLPAFSRYPDETSNEHTSTFDGEAARNITSVFSDIKNELILNIPKNTQLTETKRKSVEESIKNVRLCQSNWIFNKTELEKHYAGIYPFKTTYLEQMATLWSWKNAKAFHRYGKVLEDICDGVDGFSASYVPAAHQMNVPPTLWMEPFYNKEWPAYLKYSGVADTIGHEMIHALVAAVPEWVDNPNPDPENIIKTKGDQKYTLGLKEVFAEGRSRYSSAVSTSHLTSRLTTPTFRSSQCMVNHYERFSLSERKYTLGLLSFLSSDTDTPKINGTRTFEENFSDIGGIQLAFAAYKAALQKNGGIGAEKQLPGLTKYTNEQVFFLNYARKWCDARSPIIRKALLKLDEHSPAEFRVLGTLRNNQDFAKAWNCPAGSFMNPVEKCPVF